MKGGAKGDVPGAREPLERDTPRAATILVVAPASWHTFRRSAVPAFQQLHRRISTRFAGVATPSASPRRTTRPFR